MESVALRLDAERPEQPPLPKRTRLYRSILRDHSAWRMLAAHAGALTPGLVKRAKAWGGEL